MHREVFSYLFLRLFYDCFILFQNISPFQSISRKAKKYISSHKSTKFCECTPKFYKKIGSTVTNFITFYACEISNYSLIYIIYCIEFILFYAIRKIYCWFLLCLLFQKGRSGSSKNTKNGANLFHI